jgi:hypothetical protein
MKRYDIDLCETWEHPEGGWVRYEDVATLKEDRDRLATAVDLMKQKARIIEAEASAVMDFISDRYGLSVRAEAWSYAQQSVAKAAASAEGGE